MPQKINIATFVQVESHEGKVTYIFLRNLLRNFERQTFKHELMHSMHFVFFEQKDSNFQPCQFTAR